MKKAICLLLFAVLCLTLLAAAPEEKTPRPQYDERASLSVRRTIANGCFSPPGME